MKQYKVIYADPPWEVRKIVRQVRPNQPQTIAGQAKWIAELEAENKQLRACHDSELGVCQQHCDVVADLEAELAFYRSLFCEAHQPDRKDAPTTCPCCEAVRQADKAAAVEKTQKENP